jgi:hypothetical protein
MPLEHEDARARQIEALRRYVAQLRTQREGATEFGAQQDQPNSGPTGPRPAPTRWRLSLPLTGLLVVSALIGGVLVGKIVWSNDRPAGTGAVVGVSSATQSPTTTTTTTTTTTIALVATPACKTAVDRANALLAIAVKLQRELAEYSRFMRDPSNGNLSVAEVVVKRAPSMQAGAGDSARFDRALADYRQIVDRCTVRTP